MTAKAGASSVQETRAVEDGSPVPRHWLVIAGAAAMAGVMLIAVFSLGVWVGSGRDDPTAFVGLGAAGRVNDGPGQPQQRGGPPTWQFGGGLRGQGPGGLLDSLSRPPDVVGQIQWLEGDTVGLNTPAGLEIVTVLEETEFLQADGSAGSGDDLDRGRVIAVVGDPSDDGRSLVAEELMMLPERP